MSFWYFIPFHVVRTQNIQLLFSNNKWTPFYKYYNQTHSMNGYNLADNIHKSIFFDEKLLYFDSFFTEVCYYDSMLRLVSLGSVNQMAPKRQQAITWTNGHANRWCIYASPSLSELIDTWWRHQMETFSALLVIYAENSPVSGEFPAQRPVTRGIDVFFDLRLNKQLSKQSWGWWFEMPSCPLWCQYNVDIIHHNDIYISSYCNIR